MAAGEDSGRQGAAPASPARILVVRFSSLGDLILTLPVARSLKAAYPGAEITFLTRPAFRPLLEGQPGIDRVADLGEASPGIRGLARFCRDLGPFDLVVDLHRTLRSRFCLGFVGARRREVYRKDSLRRRLWAMGWLRDSMQRERRHVVDRYLEPLRRLGLEPRFDQPELVLDERETGEARTLLREAGVSDPSRVALLFPGARWPNKRWTAAGFAAVAARLRADHGLEPVLGGDAADQDQISRVRELTPGGAVVLAGRTGLRQLAALLRVARVVVANDSGPAHLAAAVGTPVVALFGPTVPAFGFTPRGPLVRVVSRDLTCRPCTVHGGTRCPRGERRCLDGIGAGEVLAAVDELLGEWPAAGDSP
jgi:lipopolysaccharide heptosyltransferase II